MTRRILILVLRLALFPTPAAACDIGGIDAYYQQG